MNPANPHAPREWIQADQALLVHEKVEEAEVVQGETEGEEREEKYERLDEVFQLFLQRTGPRLALRRSYTKRVRGGGPIGKSGAEVTSGSGPGK